MYTLKYYFHIHSINILFHYTEKFVHKDKLYILWKLQNIQYYIIHHNSNVSWIKYNNGLVGSYWVLYGPVPPLEVPYTQPCVQIFCEYHGDRQKCFFCSVAVRTPCGVPQPIRDLDCAALLIRSHRSEGGFDKLTDMWTPPVKSTNASAGVPAFMSE